MIQHDPSTGHLHIDGVDVCQIAEKFGTPLYLYAGDSIKSGIKSLKDALPSDLHIHYSIKANPALAIARLIHTSGIDRVEIASAGELCAALASGFDPSHIIFAGPGKTDEELHASINAGIAQINAESNAEIIRINTIANNLGVVQSVGIRINPESQNASQGKIQTGGGVHKFGIDESKAQSAIELIQRSKQLKFEGLHTMLGSQVLNAEHMLRSCQRAIESAVNLSSSTNTPINTLNFGGGLGVAHHDDEPDFDLHHFGTQLNQLINQARNNPTLKHTRFILEPGRILVSKHGYYISTVIDLKESVGQPIAILDGGIHHALLPITANSYQVTLANRPMDSSSDPITLGGPLCTSADQWRSQVSLPHLQVGDLIVMHNSGAYGLTASMNNFLSKGTPAEILIYTGQCSSIRERSTPQALLDGQHIPASLAGR